MERAGVEAWLVLGRENANDPIAPHVGAENAGGLAARNIADGLSWTQRTALAEAIGPELAGRLVSCEGLVVEWVAVKLPEEVEIMRRAAALTEQHGREADRGHSHATEKVIQPGDVIQTDFGIRVHDRWVTDIQRFAYVLRPGETAPPPEMQARWEHAREGSRAAFAAMRPGATGWDADKAQREVLVERGSIPLIWRTGHPVGFWAHDLGPRLGGAASGDAPSVESARPLREGPTFAFNGCFGWGREDGTTKTISVEERVVITEDGAEWLVPPQEERVVIPPPLGGGAPATG
jgi:Xaa-Pro aminopeptidase